MTTKAQSGTKLQSFTGIGLTGLMLITDSMYFVFARLLQPFLPPEQATLYSMTIGMLLVAGYAANKRRLHFRVLFENIGFFMLIGFLIAFASNMSYTAMHYIDPGTASILSQTTIVFGLVWGLVWLREKLTSRQIIGAVIAIAGVVVITFQKGDYLRLGSLIIVLSSLSYSFHSAVVKKYGAKFDFLEFYAFRMICNCLCLFVWALFTTDFMVPPAGALPFILLVAAVDICISRPLYYAVLHRYSVSILSILLTISPILTVAWS
ncbi:MAG: DMT family transporter, partial [Anaerolineaceae bacterium]